MQFYEQNLQALFSVNPLLASKLHGVNGNEKFEVFVDEKDSLNVNITCNGEPMYEGVPLQQSLHMCDAYEDEYLRYPYVFFYGIGNGLFYRLLLQNSEHKKVFIIENELELIYIALNLNDFVDDIKSGRLVIFLEEDFNFSTCNAIFFDQSVRIFTKTYHLEIFNSYYEKHYRQNILNTNKIFVKTFEHAIYAAGNDSIDALIGIEHQVANIEKMLETPTLIEFVRRSKTSEVAILVSTGPSLKKQLPLLKKIQNSVTIFCVDSSFPILYKEGIKPDIVVSMERVVATAKFYRDIPSEAGKDVVFAMTSIVHPALLDNIKEGTLQVSQRPFGYTRYFSFDDYGYVGIGMSAANMAYEMIFHSKFEKIVIIGQDLAYARDGKSHSDGHLYGVNDKKSSMTLYDVEAYGGDGVVKTNRLWLLFKNSFEADFHHATSAGITTINATEGGARIDNCIEMSFKDAVEKYVDVNFNKELIKLEYPTKEEIESNKKAAQDKVAHMLSYAKVIYKEIEELFLKVASQCEEFDKVKVYDNLEQVDYEHIETLMNEIDRIKQNFDSQEFVNIFIDATQAMIVNQELDLAKIQVRPVKTNSDKRKKMVEWIYAHQKWLFDLAGMVNAVIVAVERGGSAKNIISKVYLRGNIITGHIFDISDLEKDFEIDIYVDALHVKHLKPELELQHTLLDEPKISRFFYELPKSVFDGQSHQISIQESESGVYLEGAPITQILLKEAVVNGLVWSNDNILYKGWCKEIDSLEP
ncbi:MAG: motility associated factor glycosyltransferase family protein, partial [Campylobacterota bacterium]|nr:motility associated factor glycosyltransferase family protein [Campylobacterota bacterium]